MTLPWDQILAFAVQIIKECIEDGQEEAVVKDQIRRPRGRARIRLYRGVRIAMGMDQREWRQHRQEVMELVLIEAENLDNDSVDEIYQMGRVECEMATEASAPMPVR